MTPTDAQIAKARAILWKAGHDVAKDDLVAALTAAAEVVDKAGPSCPTCGASEPDWNAAAAFDAQAAAEVELKNETKDKYWPRTPKYDPGTIERCAQELEAAHAECSTLSLLHGAARLRALKDIKVAP